MQVPPQAKLLAIDVPNAVPPLLVHPSVHVVSPAQDQKLQHPLPPMVLQRSLTVQFAVCATHDGAIVKGVAVRKKSHKFNFAWFQIGLCMREVKGNNKVSFTALTGKVAELMKRKKYA